MSDLISRLDAIDALEAKKDKTAKGNIGQFYNTIIQRDIAALIDLPTIDAVEVVHGEWIMFERPNGGYYKGCSLCTYPMPTDMELDYLCEEDNRYCYNCGAKMDGKEKNDE